MTLGDYICLPLDVSVTLNIVWSIALKLRKQI